MSMWRAIATRIGSVFDRPDPGNLPYGTQWHDPDTGNTWATDETAWYPLGSAAGVGPVGPWVGNDIAYALQYQDLTLLDGLRTVLPMCSPVNVECVVVYLSSVITYGTVQVTLTVNGVETGEPITLDEGNCRSADLDVYVETCDVIGFSLSTSPDLEHEDSAEDLNVTVMARLGAPIPPDTSPGEEVHTITRHGIVLGHAVTGGEVSDLPVNAFARYRASELALSDTDPVDTWPDEGSGGNDLLQATGAEQPTYEAAGFNGHPSVLFNSGENMQTAVYGASESQPNTIVLIGEYVTVDDTSTQYVFDGLTFGEHALRHLGATTGDPWNLFAGTSAVASDTPVGKDGNDLCMVAIFNGATSELRVNDGANLISGDPDAGSDALTGFTLMGIGSTGGLGANMRVVEVLIYARALDAGEITGLQSYFTATYT